MLAGISSLIAIAYAVGIYLCVIWQRTLSPNSLPIRFPLRISMPASPLARRDAIDFGVWTRNLKTEWLGEMIQVFRTLQRIQ